MLAVSKHHSVYMRTLRVLTCGVFFYFPPLSESGRAKKDCREHSHAVFSFVQAIFFSRHSSFSYMEVSLICLACSCHCKNRGGC